MAEPRNDGHPSLYENAISKPLLCIAGRWFPKTPTKTALFGDSTLRLQVCRV